MRSPSPCPTGSLLPRWTAVRGSLSNFLAERWILCASLGMNLLPASLESSVALDGGPGAGVSVGAGGWRLPLLLSVWRWPIFVHRSQGVLVEHRRWVLRPFQSLEAPSKMEDGFRWVSVFVTDDQKSGGNLQRGLMLVILLVPGFFCKIPGMYCASFVIQSLFRKK
jgi:hypothetical protein